MEKGGENLSGGCTCGNKAEASADFELAPVFLEGSGSLDACREIRGLLMR